MIYGFSWFPWGFGQGILDQSLLNIASDPHAYEVGLPCDRVLFFEKLDEHFTRVSGEGFTEII